jgi:branched-subunit amino acid ABC-type transport system permease component
MDMTAIIDCFVIIVIGGMGSYGGAFLAAIILGLLNAFGIIVLPKVALAFGFLLMAIVLIFRPWGLMGKEE